MLIGNFDVLTVLIILSEHNAEKSVIAVQISYVSKRKTEMDAHHVFQLEVPGYKTNEQRQVIIY